MVSVKTKQNIIVVIVALIVIALSVVVTVFVNKFSMEQSGSSTGGYQNVTFTDAVVACREETFDTYGSRIRNLVTDNHSSRFDGKRYIYKIFLEVDLVGKKDKTSKLHYVNCFVRSKNGNISKYDVFKSDEERREEKDDGTNMFSMPKK